MRAAAVAALLAACLPAAGGAGLDAVVPKGATVVGTVSARRGNRVVVLANAEGLFRPGQQLGVGRAALLVSLAKGKGKLAAWGDWQDAGRIRVRILRGARCCIAFIAQEAPRTGIDGKPAPNIRPGDTVLRISAGRKPP